MGESRDIQFLESINTVALMVAMFVISATGFTQQYARFSELMCYGDCELRTSLLCSSNDLLVIVTVILANFKTQISS
jgi:hypothetical protein